MTLTFTLSNTTHCEKHDTNTLQTHIDEKTEEVKAPVDLLNLPRCFIFCLVLLFLHLNNIPDFNFYQFELQSIKEENDVAKKKEKMSRTHI